MYTALIQEKKNDFEKAIEHLQAELAKLRTGRATPSLIEDVKVDYYGTKTPLKQMAAISSPDPRSLMVQAWDRGALALIENAIRESDLGLNPNNDGVVIRINIPALTEERRKDLVKVLNQKAEEARIAVRAIREDAWKEIQEMEKEGGINEDDKFKAKDKLQEVVDVFNKKIEEVIAKKEQDIMTV